MGDSFVLLFAGSLLVVIILAIFGPMMSYLLRLAWDGIIAPWQKIIK